MIDSLVDSNRRTLALENARGRDISNLEHWVDSTACLARQETAYLAKGEDLMAVASPADGALNTLEGPIEDLLIWAAEKLKKVQPTLTAYPSLP